MTDKPMDDPVEDAAAYWKRRYDVLEEAVMRLTEECIDEHPEWYD